MTRLTPVVKNLLILNVGIFLLVQLLADTYPDIITRLMLFPFQSEYFSPYQLFTCMFLHFELRHIFMNMLVLLFMGPILEQTIGDRKFLILYVSCGLVASLTQGFVFYVLDINAPMLGASGATMGVLLATAIFYPNIEVMIYFLFPLKLKWLAIFFVAYDLFNGLVMSNTGVAHFAHLGGAAFAIILVLIWRQRRMI